MVNELSDTMKNRNKINPALDGHQLMIVHTKINQKHAGMKEKV